MSHPAPEELLLDYAAGALAAGPALAVSLHVALDPAARRTVGRLGALGGALIEGEGAGGFDEAALQRTLARLDGIAVEPRPAPYVPRPGFEWAPEPLARHFAADTNWRRVFGGFEEIRLRLPSGSHRVSLLKLEPGRGLPMHRHVGEEYTVVLQGGYTDSTGNYRVGDFAVGPGPQEHEPIADPGPACIALIVVEKPIVLTGPFGRFLNPLVKRDLI
ncbi:MAG TPA: ChrR family anti-sigma-E factor [Dongiaceae bacterium]|jgi:putative transcriptional regulator|nr:ChrR family anti-sigma-E factor [Dongiaceae bacterium]